MLKPCEGCRRHIDESERACPFCGAANTSGSGRWIDQRGRLSRAAVFASVLAVPGCYTDPPQQQYVQQPPPPPPDDRSPPDRGPDFAQPPPDEPQRPPVAAGSVQGFVLDGNSRNPYPGVPVWLHGGPQPLETVTDQRGFYRFDHVAEGRYTVRTVANGVGAQQIVDVVRNRSNLADLRVPIPRPPDRYDRSNIPKPYGAPPYRRRVV